MSNFKSLYSRTEQMRKSMREERQVNPVNAHFQNLIKMRKDNSKQKTDKEDRKSHSEKQDKIAIGNLIKYNTSKESENKEKFILDEKLGFPNYVNVLNSMRNPDIITGGNIRFLKGNKYRAKVATQHQLSNTEEKEIEIIENKKDKVESSHSDSDSENSDDKSSCDDKIQNRYYHKESKLTKFRN